MLSRILSPNSAVPVFIFVLIFMFFATPLYVYLFDNQDSYNIDVMTYCIASCFMIAIGSILPIFDRIGSRSIRQIKFNQRILSYIIVMFFLIFLILTFATADGIPILSYFTGATANDLSSERGALFKAREGWQIALLYLFTLFSQMLMPYAVTAQFLMRDQIRWVSLALFFLFTVSFLQKFLFVNAIIPLIYAYSITHHKTKRAIYLGLIGIPLVLYMLTLLSMGSSEEGATANAGYQSVFNADFRPATATESLIWRAIAVPVFTATDTLHVFHERLGGEFLGGATSNLIAGVTGAERVNLEREVFAYQWGWSDIANANTVYFVDAYANFGWFGLCLISLIIGQSLRWFRLSRDLAMRSLWPLYCLGLFNATFVAMLFSNGYLLVWAMLLFTMPGNRQIASTKG